MAVCGSGGGLYEWASNTTDAYWTLKYQQEAGLNSKPQTQVSALFPLGSFNVFGARFGNFNLRAEGAKC